MVMMIVMVIITTSGLGRTSRKMSHPRIGTMTSMNGVDMKSQPSWNQPSPVEKRTASTSPAPAPTHHLSWIEGYPAESRPPLHPHPRRALCALGEAQRKTSSQRWVVVQHSVAGEAGGIQGFLGYRTTWAESLGTWKTEVESWINRHRVQWHGWKAVHWFTEQSWHTIHLSSPVLGTGNEEVNQILPGGWRLQKRQRRERDRHERRKLNVSLRKDI